MSVNVEADGAKNAGEEEWIELATEVAEAVPEVDQVLIWSDQARFHFDAGDYSGVDIAKTIQAKFRERVDERGVVSGGAFAYIQDVDGHTNTKEVRARNPFR